MSASAPEAAERTEWRGEGIELDAVVQRFMRMNRDHARADGHEGHASTRTLNLLVAPGADVAGALLDAWLDSLSARHPSRTIVLCEHPAARLDALLAIDCALGCTAGATGWCHDTAVLSADAARLRHADSLVHSLLVGGLPIVLWLPGAQESPATAALAPLAEAIVLDSGAADDLRGALARAARLDGRVRDLAWQRLARWRQRVAARFDAPPARTLLARAERVEVRCGGPDMAAPLLLAGWVAARAGWTLERLDGDADGWHGTARRADGAEVTLTIGGAPAPDGIHALTFAAGDEQLRLDEPVAEPGAQRAFAAALRSFDVGAPGYAPALAALCAGLGIAPQEAGT